MSASGARKRILFIAEAVTLAHVVRPAVLARALDADRFEVHFACAQGNDWILKGASFVRWPIQSISGEQFLKALAVGARLYDERTLDSYVEDDLRLLEQVRPDLVVGDFRLSLAVSAPLRKIPFAAVVNAHWSPYNVLKHFPLPDLPMIRFLSVPVSRAFFRLAQPAVFAYHARPLNAVRRRHGLAPLGDLRHVYTHGDYTLYADVPGLVPTSNLPPNHHYIGPILWSPETELPSWWDDLPKDRPCVYVTLGSSGQVDLLPMVVDALAKMALTVLVATAGRLQLTDLPNGVWAADYLPGTLAARRSSLVICSGGSATAYQALAEGVPVLGLASNMDQHLTMGCVERVGAGRLLRAGQLNKESFLSSVRQLLRPEYKVAAQRIGEEFAQFQAPARLRSLIDSWL